MAHSDSTYKAKYDTLPCKTTSLIFNLCANFSQGEMLPKSNNFKGHHNSYCYQVTMIYDQQFL